MAVMNFLESFSLQEGYVYAEAEAGLHGSEGVRGPRSDIWTDLTFTLGTHLSDGQMGCMG